MAAQKTGVTAIRFVALFAVALFVAPLFLSNRAFAQDTGGANPPAPLPPPNPDAAAQAEKQNPPSPQFEDTTGKPVAPPPLEIDRVRNANKLRTPPNSSSGGTNERKPGDTATPGARKGREVKFDNAGETTYSDDNQIVTARGNVRLETAGYIVTSEKAQWDRKNHFVVAEGKVVMTGTPYPVYADYVRINTRTREFDTRGGRTIVPAENIGSQIVQPVYISGETLARVGNNYKATNGLLTTCDFPNPHFKIGFRQLDLIPRDRIVLRDNILYRYDSKIARIKYLTFPIREEPRFSYLPEFGRTNEEGYYVKAALGYALRQTLPGILRVDVLQKKGIGLGFDQAYTIGAGAAVGTLALYTLNDKSQGSRNVNGRVNHQQYFGDTLATISSDFQSNAYQALTSSSRTSNTTLNLDRTDGKRRTGASVTYGRSDYGTTNSDNASYTFTQVEPIGAKGNLTFRLNGSDNNSRSSFNDTTTKSGRAEQSADLRATGTFGIFDADVSANKNLFNREKGGGTAPFFGTQKLPDFLLTTDLERLLGVKPSGGGYGGFGSFGGNGTRPKTTRPNQKNDPNFKSDPNAKDNQNPRRPNNQDNKSGENADSSTNIGGQGEPPVTDPETEPPRESFGSKLVQVLPLRFSVGFGRFLENVTRFNTGGGTSNVVPVTTNRFLFNAETSRDPQFSLTPGGALTLSAGGGFRQTMYRSDAAQYIVTGRSTLRQRFGENSALNFNYNYQRPYGGTPLDFRLDRIGAFNNLGANLGVTTYRTRLSATTGFDLERAGIGLPTGVQRNPWQNLGVQLGLRPSDWFQTRFTTTYDINHGRLLDVTNRMRFRGQNFFALDTSLRYDPIRYKFPQVTSALTVPLFSQNVFLNALNGYNGITYKWDYQRYSVTWGFHDYEYLITYVDQPYGFRSERGFNIAIRLRALPQARSTQTGQFGTAIDNGSGEVF